MPVIDRNAVRRVLEEVVRLFDSAGLPYVVGGGLAYEAYSLRETVNDIDLFVRPIDAPRASEILAEAGFRTWVEDPRWLYKAAREGIVVDIIYESAGLVHVGDETIRRARVIEIDGVRARVMPPEDLFVMKALAAQPGAPKHWLDAIHILSTLPMDWEYLVSRVGQRPRKVIRAILHAHDEGTPVPADALVKLVKRLEGM